MGFGQLQIRNTEQAALLSADFVNCWVPIEQVVLEESVTEIVFVDISQRFRSLFLIIQCRTDYADEEDEFRLQFNGDAGANYDWLNVWFDCNVDPHEHECMRGDISIKVTTCEAALSRANNYSTSTHLFPGYTEMDREKWIITSQSGRFGDVSADTDLGLGFARGRWQSLEAITRIRIFPENGTNFVPGCQFALYGII